MKLNKGRPCQKKSIQTSKRPRKQTKKGQKSNKSPRTMEFVVCLPMTAGQGPDLLALHWRHVSSLCQWVSVADSFLIRVGTQSPLLPFSTGILSILNLCRPFVCCQSSWAHTCISPPVSGTCCFLGVICQLLESVCLLFHFDPWGLRGEVWWRHHVEDWVSLFAHCPVVGLWKYPSA